MTTKPFSAIVPAPLQPVYDGYGFAPAVRVGNDLHISGIMGYNADQTVPDDLASQIGNIFDHMAMVLAEAGASLSDVFSLTSYHVGDLASQMPVFIGIQAERLGKPHPAWTALGTTQLALPGALVEVAAIARLAHG